MLKPRRIYLHLTILAAAPALFIFCEDKDKLKKKPLDHCERDYISTSTHLFGPATCTLVVHDAQCNEKSIDITCDQRDQILNSPEQAQNQSTAALIKQSGGKVAAGGGAAAPASAAAGSNVLVQSLQRLLSFGNDLYTASPAGTPSLTCDPGLNFYAVEHASGTVAHEFPCASPPFPRIPVVTRPLQVATTPDSREVWVTSYDNGITVIDTNTDKVLATIATDANTFPSGIAISPDGTRVYVTSFIDFGAALITYDQATRTEIARLGIPTEYPQSVFLTPDGSTAIVTHPLNNVIYMVDILSNTIIASRPISEPYGVGFSANGATAYVSSWPNSVVAIDMTTLNPIMTYPVGNSPIHVVVSPTGRWITTDNYGDGTISTIDTISGSVTSLQVGNNPHGITVVN